MRSPKDIKTHFLYSNGFKSTKCGVSSKDLKTNWQEVNCLPCIRKGWGQKVMKEFQTVNAEDKEKFWEAVSLLPPYEIKRSRGSKAPSMRKYK